MINKIIILFLFAIFAVKPAISQTYIYDNKLKAPEQILKEYSTILNSKIYSTDEIISEFMANEIRATQLYTNKCFLIKGRIAKIFNMGKDNFIALRVSEDENAKNFLYINLVNMQDKTLKFDKIENYSVGDWINIYSSGFMKYPKFSYEYLFFGVVFHTKDLLERKNHLVKIINLPDDVIIRYEHDDTERTQKFSSVVDGKSYCKFFNIGTYTTISVKFFKQDGTLIKQSKLRAKINCHSIFDYNKL